jgi:alcohol dehydrogenase (NADP+)
VDTSGRGLTGNRNGRLRKTMFQTNAMVVATEGATFERTVIERHEPGLHDVRIDIAYCGICHSDLSYAHNEWGRTLYPLVPGHEIAGVVSAIGPEVQKFQVGDRVGVGCLVDTCGTCSSCQAGYENHCYGQRVSTYSSRDKEGRATDGGYSEAIVVNENFVVRIPDSLELSRAAPLLCAGITVYSPLTRWGAGPGKRVGVVGMGGLGHVALQIAAALGSEVTVFDLDEAKADDAARLGAKNFVTDRDAPKQMTRALDIVICTVPAKLDLDAYLNMLDISGVFVVIGIPDGGLSVDPFSLIINQRALAGSRIGSLTETQEMLDFCGANGVGAEVEVIEASYLDRAYERVKAGDVKFRFVLDTTTIAS